MGWALSLLLNDFHFPIWFIKWVKFSAHISSKESIVLKIFSHRIIWALGSSNLIQSSVLVKASPSTFGLASTANWKASSRASMAASSASTIFALSIGVCMVSTMVSASYYVVDKWIYGYLINLCLKNPSIALQVTYAMLNCKFCEHFIFSFTLFWSLDSWSTVHKKGQFNSYTWNKIKEMN